MILFFFSKNNLFFFLNTRDVFVRKNAFQTYLRLKEHVNLGLLYALPLNSAGLRAKKKVHIYGIRSGPEYFRIELLLQRKNSRRLQREWEKGLYYIKYRPTIIVFLMTGQVTFLFQTSLSRVNT